MAEEALRTDEVRQMANSYDGVPNDVFDRWLAQHDREVHAAGVAEGIRQAKAAVEDELPHLNISEASSDVLRDILDALET